ncbi:MAG TPA: hypothetical protein VED02_00490, partial [Methyloceanibacter sp.]|nr:hypothetical protein [Methyloceanibacter sp.]
MVQPFHPTTLFAAPDRNLRKAGLARGKVATLRALAEAIDQRTLKIDALNRATEEVIDAKLTVIKGIGPWTADIYIMFSLARADARSPDALALQHGAKDALLLAERPSLVQMNEVAEARHPSRGVAARLLWSYYALRWRPNAVFPRDQSVQGCVLARNDRLFLFHDNLQRCGRGG